jgi:RNA polymerase sigma-70 factor (ECF subfamily)
VSSDDEVVAAAKRGDADAWRALYRDHAGRLLVWLSTRPSGDSAVTAEDLAAETWLVAAERIHSFTGTSADFAGWLFGVARNLGSNTHRRSLRRATYATDPHELGEPGVVAGPESSHAAQDWVIRALATLPPRERDVVGCLDVVGLDIETTARALGMSAVAVRVARHRGLKRLRGLAPGPQDTSSERSPAR